MEQRSSFELFAEARFKLQDLIQRISFDLKNNYSLLREEIRAGLAFLCIYVDVIRGLDRLIDECLNCGPIRLVLQKSTHASDPRKESHADLKRACRYTDETVHILSRDLELDRDIEPIIHSLELLNHR
ncbi:hypothetical protein PENANT_c021G09218 [Penicillium antarcticum]|uniref:Uncharacterized protein n=1 Tax=Penicillium antarcticum TaxID=416450 RepID=A0A1V6PZF8_9EURO|nr:hypothetical protein PENANT_c021G09218 [Penicillium antarcticum]